MFLCNINYMNRQQAINKYVDLIKKYQKKKKSKKLLASDHGPPHLLNLTHVLFTKSVQQKIKTKVKQKNQPPPILHPTLNTIVIERQSESQMGRTKRKFEAYQELMEKKYSEKQAVAVSLPHRQREKPLLNQMCRNIFQEPDTFVPILNQTTSLLKGRSQLPKSLPNKQPHRSEHNTKGAELDGSIFHFDNAPPAPFFRNMFHNREQPQKTEVYELLKTMSPITIKSKMLKQGFSQSRPFAFPKKIRPEQPIDQNKKLLHQKALSRLHKRQRSSLINLRLGEDISGWQITDDR